MRLSASAPSPTRLALACRSDSRSLQRGGAKSFVDDLALGRGAVPSRAVFYAAKYWGLALARGDLSAWRTRDVNIFDLFFYFINKVGEVEEYLGNQKWSESKAEWRSTFAPIELQVLLKCSSTSIECAKNSHSKIFWVQNGGGALWFLCLSAPPQAPNAKKQSFKNILSPGWRSTLALFQYPLAKYSSTYTIIYQIVEWRSTFLILHFLISYYFYTIYHAVLTSYFSTRICTLSTYKYTSKSDPSNMQVMRVTTPAVYHQSEN